MAVKILIIGGEGNGAVIADAINQAAKTSAGPIVAGFVNDRLAAGEKIGGYPVVGSTALMPQFIKQGYHFIYTILRIDGQDERLGLFDKLNIPDNQLFTFVHPLAYVAPTAKLGPGTVIMPNASVSAQAVLGKGCLVMVNASIGHNTNVGNFCHFAAQSCVSSFVNIDNGVHIGLNATVRENLHLGSCSTVGMGSVLLTSINPYEVWVGNPARFLRKAR